VNSQGSIAQVAPVTVEIGQGREVVLDLFHPQDAPGIVELFRTVYGDGYPVKRFYHPVGLKEAHASGDSYSVVVRGSGGEIVGHVAIFRSSPYQSLYEGGAGLVLPEYRQGGINKVLLGYLYDKVVPALGIEEVWGEAVCNHVYMQKSIAQCAHVETGLEVDLMPAETYDKERSASGRVASLLVFRAYRPKPHTIYLPEAYATELGWLVAGLDDQRRLARSEAELPLHEPSRATIQIFEFARVARIAIHAIGGDFEQAAAGLEHDATARGAKILQAWVKLACPWVGRAVDLLRARGYFLGGLLPRWFDDDGLLLQKIIGEPNWDEIQLYSERAREILRLIKQDWARLHEGAR
jgi:hypothetical protein